MIAAPGLRTERCGESVPPISKTLAVPGNGVYTEDADSPPKLDSGSLDRCLVPLVRGHVRTAKPLKKGLSGGTPQEGPAAIDKTPCPVDQLPVLVDRFSESEARIEQD